MCHHPPDNDCHLDIRVAKLHYHHTEAINAMTTLRKSTLRKTERLPAGMRRKRIKAHWTVRWTYRDRPFSREFTDSEMARRFAGTRPGAELVHTDRFGWATPYALTEASTEG